MEAETFHQAGERPREPEQSDENDEIPLFVCTLDLLFTLLGGHSDGLTWTAPEAWAGLETSRDIYYGTEGSPVGPSVKEVRTDYPRVAFVDNRVLVWMVTQQHTYFGGFVLALPFFTVLLEFLGLSRRDPQASKNMMCWLVTSCA